VILFVYLPGLPPHWWECSWSQNQPLSCNTSTSHKSSTCFNTNAYVDS